MDDSLEVTIGKINAIWRKADDHQATLCVLMANAEALVKAGDPFAAGMSWAAFSAVHFKNKYGVSRPMREVNRLVRIGNADDPQVAMNEHRANTATRMRQLREDRVSRDTPSAGAEIDPRRLVARYMDQLGVTIEQMIAYFEEE